MIFNQTILIELLSIYTCWIIIGMFTAKLFYSKFDQEYKDEIIFKNVGKYRFTVIFMFSLLWPVAWFLFITSIIYYFSRSFIGNLSNKSNITSVMFIHKVLNEDRYEYFKESILLSNDGNMAFIYCIDTNKKEEDKGTISVFRRNNISEWEVLTTIDSDEQSTFPNTCIKMAISKNGKVLVIKTPAAMNDNKIILKIYKLKDNQFECKHNLHYPPVDDVFMGYLNIEVSENGETIVVGIGDGVSGAVFIYKEINGELTKIQTLSCSLFSGHPFKNNYGFSLALSADGKTLAVGCPYTKVDTVKDDFLGYVLIYKMNENDYHQKNFYEAVEIFNSSLLKTNFNYGYSLDMADDGRTIVVGSPIMDRLDCNYNTVKKNNIIIHYLDNNNWTNIEPTKLTPVGSFNLNRLGLSVVISGDGGTIVAVSKHLDDVTGLRDVQHFIFTKYQHEWIYEDVITDSFPYRDTIPKVSTQLTENGDELVIGFSRINNKEIDTPIQAYTLNQ